MATVTGFITIADVVDGITGASLVSSNEAHTFVADADGAVTATEAGMYNTAFTCYVGSTQYSFLADSNDATGVNPGSNQFSIASDSTTESQAPSGYRKVESYTVSPSGADIAVYISSAGVIQVRDQNTSNATGFFDAGGANSATVSLSVVVDIGGVDTTYTKILTFSKALGGSAPYTRMTADNQALFFGFGASDPKSSNPASFVLTAQSFNDPSGVANWVWSYGINGAAANSNSITSGTGQVIAGAATGTSTLTLTRANLNTLLTSSGNTITFRATRGAQFDQVTIAKVEDASGGLNVVIEISNGNTVFKNNTGTTDLTAVVYRGTAVIPHADVTSYQWQKNGANFTTTVTQPSGSGASAYGSTSRNVRVGAGDVTNDGSELFSCVVVVPDA